MVLEWLAVTLGSTMPLTLAISTLMLCTTLLGVAMSDNQTLDSLDYSSAQMTMYIMFRVGVCVAIIMLRLCYTILSPQLTSRPALLCVPSLLICSRCISILILSIFCLYTSSASLVRVGSGVALLVPSNVSCSMRPGSESVCKVNMVNQSHLLTSHNVFALLAAISDLDRKFWRQRPSPDGR